MSQKIINNLFRYVASEGAKRIVITKREQGINFDYHFPAKGTDSFALPKKLEKTLMESLEQILHIIPGELATDKYCKIYDKNYQLACNLTILPDPAGEKIIINIVKKEKKLYRLAQLGLDAGQQKIIKTALKNQSGLIIVSSPDNGGRSATLYSLLSTLIDPAREIYLLADRAEYSLDGLNQLKLSAANLEKILAGDCEIIALDGMDDKEIFKKAVYAAGTGRLIIGTITANNVWEALAKIINSDQAGKSKIDNLKLIINQRVVKLARTKKNKSGRTKMGIFELLPASSELKKFIAEKSGRAFDKRRQKKLIELAELGGYRPLDGQIKREIAVGTLDPENY